MRLEEQANLLVYDFLDDCGKKDRLGMGSLRPETVPSHSPFGGTTATVWASTL